MKDFLQKKRFNRLARKMQEGNRAAAEEFFDYFYPNVFRFFMARTVNRDVSEDLAQEVFLKVISKIQTFDPKLGNFLSWTWQIARNSLTDYYREKKCLYIEECGQNITDQGSKTEIDKLNKKLEVENVLSILKKFSDQEQEIFSLYFVSDLSYRSISELTGKSEGALRILIHRINNKIKKELKC